jgi:hypothetical protein
VIVIINKTEFEPEFEPEMNSSLLVRGQDQEVLLSGAENREQ